MRFIISSVCAALALLPVLAAAQVITDPAQASAARDSVASQALTTRQRLESQTSSFKVRARRLGSRRIVTRGYAQPRTGSSVLIWKRVSRQRRSGSTEETFHGYEFGPLVMRESRLNGEITFLEVSSFGKVPFSSKPQLIKRGVLTRTGYVQWGRKSYILPTVTYRPLEGRQYPPAAR